MSVGTDAEFYTPSGRTGFSVPLMLAFGIPVALVVAAVYAYVIVYVPVIGYVNVLFLAGYVFGLGVPLAMMAKGFKCRSSVQLMLLTGFISAIGVYFSWVFFLKALLGQAGQPIPALAMVRSPLLIWEVASEIIANGWWEGGPSGVLEWIVVSIEAAIMIIGVAMISGASIDNEVFCEDCNSWCEQTGDKSFSISGEDLEVMPDHLGILKLPEADLNEIPRIKAEVLTCPKCQQTNAIRFKMLTMKVDKEGVSSLEETVIPGILLRKTEVGTQDDFDA